MRNSNKTILWISILPEDKLKMSSCPIEPTCRLCTLDWKVSSDQMDPGWCTFYRRPETTHLIPFEILQDYSKPWLQNPFTRQPGKWNVTKGFEDCKDVKEVKPKILACSWLFQPAGHNYTLLTIGMDKKTFAPSLISCTHSPSKSRFLK